jgi:integrase
VKYVFKGVKEIFDMDGIYGDMGKRVAALKKKIIDTQTTHYNKKRILEYAEHLEAMGLTHFRILFNISKLISMVSTSKDTDFTEWKQHNIESFLKWVNTYRKKNGAPLSDWSKFGYITAMKAFFRWQLDIPSDMSLPRWISWVQKPHPPNKLREEDLLSPSEVRILMDSTGDLMWKTLISVLAETGLRPGEALSMRICDVVFGQDSAKLYVSPKKVKGRTRDSRTVFAIVSYPLLYHWVNNHPGKGDQMSPLWVTRKGQQMTVMGLRNTLKYFFGKAVKEGRIKKKRFFPYLLRHGSATWKYTHLDLATAMADMGHHAGSTMIQTYVHLSEETRRDSNRKALGLEPERKIVDHSGTTNIVCPRCGAANQLGSRMCYRCALSLSVKDAMQNDAEATKKLETARVMMEVFSMLEKQRPKEFKRLEEVLKQIT